MACFASPLILFMALAQTGPPGKVVSWTDRDGPAGIVWEFRGLKEAGKEPIVMPLAGRLTITLFVEADEPIEVKIPDPLIRSPRWRVFVEPATRTEVTKGRHRWEQCFRFDPFAPGEDVLQLQPFEYRLGDGPPRKAAIPPVSIRVVTQTSPTTDVPRDITGVEAITGSIATPGRWWGVAIGLGILVLIGGFWLRRRRSVDAGKQAIARALRECRRLERMNLLESGKMERHFTLLANVLRRYIELQEGIPARRLTTTEFLVQARLSASLTKHLPFFDEFLRSCDLAKFAPPAAVPQLGAELGHSLEKWLAEQASATQIGL